MAIIHELMKSRTGATRGMEGAFNEHRLFSIVAEAGDITTAPDGDGGSLFRRLPDPRGLLALSGFADIGHTHPWDATQRLFQFTVTETRSRGSWIVRADYKRYSAEPEPTARGWLISIRGASIAKRIVEELSEVESILQNRLNYPGVAGGVRLIGPTQFKKSEQVGPVQSPFSTQVTKEDGTVVTMFLVPKPSRKVIGFDVDVPAMNVLMTRIVPNFDLRLTTRIAPFIKAVNGGRFRGARAGHVMVTDVQVDPIDSESSLDTSGGAGIGGRNQGQQKVPGRSWKISVSLLWSAEAWTPFDIVPTWTDEFGHESPIIHVDGGKVVESFRVRRTMNLESLFSLLERG